MKTITPPALFRSVAIAALFTAVSSFGASDAPAASDRAARLLSSTGFVRVENAGPYVVRGTFRIQVSTKLGRPDLTLSGDTWLYRNRAIAGSSARGTLVVRFEKDRVSELALATPAVIAALQANPRTPLSAELVAAK